MKTKTSSAKMGEMPINRLLITMAGPIIISMLVQALYNIVDSIFLGQSDPTGNALTALTVAFPWQNLMISVAVGTGVGVNALLSRSLGEKNSDRANKTAGNGITLALISWLVFVVLTITLARPFVEMQTIQALKSDPTIKESVNTIIDYGDQYLFLVSGLSIGVFLQVCFERILQSTGRTVLSMITQGVGAVINIILDPIFIFGFGMGVKGAAIATITGQIVAAIIAFYINKNFNHDVHIRWSDLKLRGEIIVKIYKVGIPSIIMASIGSVMTTCMNMILMAIKNGGTVATTVFGVYFKLQSFVFMPLFGLNNGLVPIISYNYGAKNRDRIVKTIKLGVTYACGMMLLGFTLFQTIPDKLLMMFGGNQQMIDIGVPALRIISISFLVAGFCVISSSYFQALDVSKYSMFVSIARQLLVLIPVAYLFAQTGNVQNVWWAYPIAEVISVITSGLLTIRVFKKKLSKI